MNRNHLNLYLEMITIFLHFNLLNAWCLFVWACT
jgi:hypothetical protein